MGDPHLAFAAGKDVVKKHAQWRHFETQEIETQWWKSASVPVVIDGGGSVLSAWVAVECNRVPRQELAETEGRVHTELLRTAKERELGACR